METRIDSSCRLRGVERSRIEQVVLVGASDPALLAAIVEWLPGVSCVVVCEPDPAWRKRFGTEPRSLWLPRGVDVIVAGEETVGDDPDAVLVDAAHILAGRPATLVQCLVVVDPMRAADSPSVERWAAALRDLVDPVSTSSAARLLPRLEQSVVARRSVLAFAERLAACGDAFRALELHHAIARCDPSAVPASTMATGWAHVHAFRRAAACLYEADLDTPDAAVIADLEELARVREACDDELAAKNLAHLHQCFPGVATQLDRVRAAPIEVARVAAVPWIYDFPAGCCHLDTYPLMLDLADDRITALNRPSDPRHYHAFFSRLDNPREAHACIGSSTAIASLVTLLRHNLHTTVVNWQHRVYLYEGHLPLFRRVLELVDLTFLLRPERVDMHVGPDALATWRACFAENLLRIIPAFRERLPAIVEQTMVQIEQDRLALARDATAKLAVHYTPQRHASLLAKIERGEPLRVWALTSLHTSVLQYVIEDLLAGFRELGHETELVREHDASEKIQSPAVLASLERFRPDFVVLGDHLRPEFGNVFPRELPTLTWILDELPGLVDRQFIAQLGGTDLCFPLSVEWTERYRQLGYPHAACLPFAASPTRCHVDESVDADGGVAFVTHVAEPIPFPWATGFLEALAERFDATPLPSWDLDQQRAVIDETLDAVGPTWSKRQRELLQFQGFLLSRSRDRMAMADALIEAGLPLSLYGRGWSDYPRFGPYVRGVIEPGPELGRVYRSHKVVLHINQTCNMHVRVLEAMAAGAFVLARRAGPLDHAPGAVATAFAIGRELCMFDDVDDLVVQVRRALDDEPWRQAFITRGRARVLTEHTYRTRASTMIDELRVQLQRVLVLTPAA